ncbi:hypothetical protein A2617_03450 [Candidatus Daviesbacteria bacterium RIFOXYD1_FULL_41_10]|uniref:Uncharacterized protein n=2 Tax=Candidatus Daviesiibacteriota TaxID=1752718 RepID=A0A1F5MYX1_9BACT|nr:MAG: hypothetical protein UU67_C0025G0008 [Candidatus Daviesbacteria bacterium GW2011_GWB1_41_5]OGE70578.1 MAG: hypothetical protein A2617_03450 [Candidatus Daviesbacteria bacterium RIFOXYD1_FULL_41_10]
MKYFYSHIIEIESVLVKLDEIDLSNDQKKHLAHLVDSTIHQTVLDLILSKLSKSDRRTLVAKMKENPEDKDLMKFVKEKVENIEEEIKNTVQDLKEELHMDIREARQPAGKAHA